MTVIRLIPLVAILFQICLVSLVEANEQKTCYYLDKNKIQTGIMPIVFVRASTSGENNFILLDKNGLSQRNAVLCQWSLNGGSGKKEQFSLDGNIAVPILKPTCEAPFSHEYTGVGFGDWYLILCGMISGEGFYISYREDKYFVSLESLSQWTKFTPEEFPIKGDKGY